MGDVRRMVRQWLETDEALGAAEVPLPKPALPQRTGTPAKAGPARPTSNMPSGAGGPSARPAPAFAPRPQVAPRPVVALPPSVVPVRPAAGSVMFSVERVSEEDTMARPRKAAVPIPPTPAGSILDLPPLSPEQKAAALAELKKDAERELQPYLNDIATKVVFGEGDVNAAVMFVGEGPGAEEDRTGRPFVGPSGQLLDKQIAAMGYARAQVFIANVVKLRSASYDEAWGRVKDRPPTPEEVARNIGILHRQIEIIRPKAIVTLGAPAIKWLTGTTENVSKLRGNWLDYRGLPLMPTFHPAYLLRNYTEDTRRKVWEDLKMVMEKVGKKRK